MLKPLKVTITNFCALFSLFILFAYNNTFFVKLHTIIEAPMAYIGAVFCLYLLLFAASSLLLWRYTLKPIAIAIIIINSFCLYFMQTYGVAIDKVMLINTWQTDIAEATDLLNFKLALYVLIGGILPAYLVYKIKIHYKSAQKEIIWKIISILGAFVLIFAVILPNYKNASQFMRNNRSLKFSILPVNYFASTISMIKDGLKQNHEPVIIGKNAVFSQYWGNGKKNLIVMIIGETARAKNFSLGGYARQTNKILDKYADNLFYFTDVDASGTSTAFSLPCIFSQYTRQNFTGGSEKYTENLLDLTNKNGYYTFWKENNSGCKNNCDRIESQIVCKNYACKDISLLDNLVSQIQSKKQNSLVILHQQGSHGPAYYKRYPDEFKIYTPTCDTTNLDKCSTEEIVNAYDNSIAYSSFVIAKTIDELSSLKNEYNIVVFYVSDHGESLGEKGLYLHAAPYLFAPDEQIKVPMLFWFDEKTAESLNLDTKCIREKLKQPYSHDNIFHTIQGISGISSSEYNPSLDIFASCRRFIGGF